MTARSIQLNDHYYQISELLGSGLTYYKINKLVIEGKLKKLTGKVYENIEYQGDTSDFATVAAYAPNGVFCMMTAARYYSLTTFLPDTINVAIERNMKISQLPEWPNVKIWYFPEGRYLSGIATIEDCTGCYKMYDVEKTVIDILYYRNKIGIEETSEILKCYLGRDDRNLILLHRYADALGCGKILRTYLEILL